MVRSAHRKLPPQIVLFALHKIFAEYTPSPGHCYDGCELTNCLCRGSIYPILPQNFSRNLEKLEFNRSWIEQFRKQDAKRYANLNEFSYLAYGPEKQYRAKPKFEDDFFLAFPNLKILFITRCIASQGQKLVFPKHLETLVLQTMDLRDDNLDLSYLTNLKILSLADNLITAIPRLNKTAPLEIIELDGNPLTSVSAKMLWSFCKLNTFRIDVTDNWMRYFKDECECRRFQQFAVMQNNKSNTKELWEPKCPLTCREIVTPEMQSDYNTCMSTIEENKFKWNQWIIVFSATAILLFAILTTVAVVNYLGRRKLKAKQETPTTVIETDSDEEEE